MRNRGWQLLLTVDDTFSAQVLSERLAAEGIESRIQSDPAILGVARRCRILVPVESIARARLALSHPQFTEEELSELADREGRQRDAAD